LVTKRHFIYATNNVTGQNIALPIWNQGVLRTSYIYSSAENRWIADRLVQYCRVYIDDFDIDFDVNLVYIRSTTAIVELVWDRNIFEDYQYDIYLDGVIIDRYFDNNNSNIFAFSLDDLDESTTYVLAIIATDYRGREIFNEIHFETLVEEP